MSVNGDSVLYAQDAITLDLVENEFSANTAPAMAEEELDKLELAGFMERYLNTYFSSFQGDLPPPGLYRRILRDVEGPLITATLAATHGNQIRAAELLGVNRNTLRTKIRALDIKVVRTGN